ncbi:MAG: hypothetical protein QM820_60890 [Minicystis sp.]
MNALRNTLAGLALLLGAAISGAGCVGQADDPADEAMAADTMARGDDAATSGEEKTGESKDAQWWGWGGFSPWVVRPWFVNPWWGYSPWVGYGYTPWVNPWFGVSPWFRGFGWW